MDPQQQFPGNNYDFIMNSGQKQKKPLIPKVGGGSLAGKLIPIIGGAVVLIILMWVVGSFLGGGGINKANAIGLVQTQQEITRVAKEGIASGNGNIRNVAANVTASVSTQQKEWLVVLGENGTEVKEDQFGLKLNETTDQRLADATANNTFDLAYTEVMNAYLTDYSNTLSNYFKSATTEEERTLINLHFEEVKLLLEQLPD